MEPFDQLDWPQTIIENGVPRVIKSGTEYREYLTLLQHRVDFLERDVRERLARWPS